MNDPRAYNTEHWLDLFTVHLEAAAVMSDDPKKHYEKMGISKAEIKSGQAPLPGKRDPIEHRRAVASWKIVCRDLRLFGLDLDPDTQIEPNVMEMKPKDSVLWDASPWCQVYRKDGDAIRFDGHEAKVAMAFMHFFANLCQNVDPSATIRKTLQAQGVNKDNFKQRMFGTSIANPFEVIMPNAPAVAPPEPIPFPGLAEAEALRVGARLPTVAEQADAADKADRQDTIPSEPITPSPEETP